MKDRNLFHRVDTIGNIFTSGCATRENITDGVHEVSEKEKNAGDQHFPLFLKCFFRSRHKFLSHIYFVLFRFGLF